MMIDVPSITVEEWNRRERARVAAIARLFGIGASRPKKIVAMSVDPPHNVVANYRSQGEAARAVGCSLPAICNAIAHRTTARGFFWRLSGTKHWQPSPLSMRRLERVGAWPLTT